MQLRDEAQEKKRGEKKRDTLTMFQEARSRTCHSHTKHENTITGATDLLTNSSSHGARVSPGSTWLCFTAYRSRFSEGL